jgi:tetratricopeptide (TPR) repeat protein
VTCPDEERLLSFIEGRLPAAAVAAVDMHLVGCAACREVVAAVASMVLGDGAGPARTAAGRPPTVPAPPGGPLPRGAAVGRYVVLGLVGRGGMGDVYAAYDPELDRKVALKLLHASGAAMESQERSRARLLREAKAIARLSHRNVVVVHDAGTIEDRVFVAMEFVEGQTLAAWMAGKTRPWREIRDVFLAAGRGLSAAHAAGIVHRDFKPQNVMVTADGVRVMDFGLASESEGEGEPGPGGSGDELPPAVSASAVASDSSADAEPQPLLDALTRTGTLIGTPAYMAPEQFLAERADARSDQFSFCVALHEALFGQRPFPDESLAVLSAAVIAGRVREPAQRSRAPAWLRKVLLRGLSTRREDRFPSMGDLLRALDNDPQRTRRRALALAALAVLLLGGGAIAQRAASRPGATLCRAAGDKLLGIWEIDAPAASATPATSSSRRGAARAAFLATGTRFAADTWQRASASLDDFARRWLAMYTDACEATHVRGEQSAEVLDLRMDCLRRELGSLRALTDVFVVADGEVVVQAVNAARALPDVDACADVALLRAAIPPPRDAKLRAQVNDLQHRTAELKALTDTGRAADGVKRAEALLRDARALDYGPARAEALSRVGRLRYDTGDVSWVGIMKEAFWAAFQSRHDELAADVAVEIAGRLGYERPGADSDEWARIGEALLARMGPGHERTRAWLLQARGNQALMGRRLEEAHSFFGEAQLVKERLLGADDIDVGLTVNTLSLVLLESGRLSEALAASARALRIFESTYGKDSPFVAYVVSNRGEILNALGRPAEALPLFARSLALWESSLAEESHWLAYPLTGQGQALLLQGRPAAATPPLERALRLRTRSDPEPQRLGETRFALARALWDGGGDRSRARELATAARELYSAAPGMAARIRDIDTWLRARR